MSSCSGGIPSADTHCFSRQICFYFLVKSLFVCFFPPNLCLLFFPPKNNIFSAFKRCIQAQLEHFSMMGPNMRPTLNPHIAQQQILHGEQQDLLTQNHPVPQQHQQQRSWPVTTSTSPAMLTPTPTPCGVSVGGVAAQQNWISSRPNSSSIHTPSPTSASTSNHQIQQPLPQVQRLPPPLAPTTTNQPPPSSIAPPAYAPPSAQQHLSSSGFQTSPHSNS